MINFGKIIGKIQSIRFSKRKTYYIGFNYFPVIEAHRRHDSYSINKRGLLIVSILFLAAYIVQIPSSHAETDGEILSPIIRKTSVAVAKEKIRGEANWKPIGYGSGEYLAEIPIIKAGAVIDQDNGEVIWSMNLKKKIAPASLTKVATVMTALDVSGSLDKNLIVSENAALQIPTKLGLGAGETLTLAEAVTAAILTSANDATETISDYMGSELGGGTGEFMEVVNFKLNKIGAVDSHFETSTGLDSTNHSSTVYDLAIIAREAMVNYPFIAETAATDYERLDPSTNHKVYDLPNWNALLGTYPGVNGLKIGYTEEAGHSTIVTANREGKNLIAVVIGASSLEEREVSAAVLLNYGFSKLGVEPYPVDLIDLTGRMDDWTRQLSYNGGNNDEEKLGGVNN